MSFWGPHDPTAPGGERALDIDARGPEAAEPEFTEIWEPPGPIAEEFYFCDDLATALRGPVGSGKTRTHMASRLRRARMAPRSVIDGRRRYKVVFARQTYRQLWQTTIPSWFEVVPRAWGKWAGGRGDPVTHAIELEDEYGVIEFTAEFLAFGEAPSEITANMRGVQTTDLSLEEADTVDPTVIAVGIGRVDRFPPKAHFAGMSDGVASWGQVSATYNACDETNPIIGLFEPESAPDPKMREVREALEREWAAAPPVGGRVPRIRFFRQPGGREPGAENLRNLSPGYYANQVAVMRAGGRSDEIKRLVDNELGFVRQGDPVFAREYNPRVHVAPEPLRPKPGEGLILGFDQGFFGAMVVLGFTPPYQWRVYGEFLLPERTFAEDFGDEAARFLDAEFPDARLAEAHGDMAGDSEAAHAQAMDTWNAVVGEAVGVAIMGQTVGANRIAPRLAAIRAGFDWVHHGEPGILIDPRCRHLRRGFEAAYVWQRETDKDGSATAKPKKAGCREADVIDALAHAMLSRSTPSGLTPVTGREARGRARRDPNPDELPAAAARSAQWDPFAVWRTG